MKVPIVLWQEAKKLAQLMSQDDWQGPGVRFRPSTSKACIRRQRRKYK